MYTPKITTKTKVIVVVAKINKNDTVPAKVQYQFISLEGTATAYFKLN